MLVPSSPILTIPSMSKSDNSNTGIHVHIFSSYLIGYSLSHNISYPFAMVAIDLTGLAFKWLENGTLNYYHYTVATHWPLPLEQFMEVVCKSLFINFG